ncbi:Glyoxalase/bleomycin resistance protein/dioxygenase [Rippkaea orientalis PCC 8801]|uniref:Glyoxalase/bleomycin resistance protein/dioxygenase n=1 Tax=Rippkaea orientalis (strain PCC 8801 / RF-1) TaxID=41431 RepID=B7K6A8_RIPO1|nr:VOC family protein [Rippkaea orientalis]ACK68161.1 Glyoxalase/bleomycin resistance protein/dioxygenase [Rippkaea orientalis PCC 8801]
MGVNYRTAFVTLATVNFETVVQFYGQLLQQDPNPFLPQIYAEFQLSGLTLGIFCPKSDHQSEFGNSQGSGISLCLEVTDLEAAIAILHPLGARVSHTIIKADHGQEIYAYDPDGNRLILVEFNR